MPSPELAAEVPFRDTKETEPSVRALYGVPLIDLLEGENKNCAIAQDPVSIYSIDMPNGREYAVVFPPLSGQDLHKRLAGISKIQAGIFAVSADFYEITNRMQGTRAKAHASGLGVLWEIFSRSLPIQTNVFHDGLHNEKTEEQRQQEEILAKRKVQGFEALSQLTPQPFTPIMDLERRMIDMVEGKRRVQTEELIDVFKLKAREISAVRSRDKRRVQSVKTIRKQIRGETSKIPQDQWNNLVLRAAKAKVIKDEKDPDENNRYFTRVLHSFARQIIKLPRNTLGISRGLEYFTIPRLDGVTDADMFEEDTYRVYFVHNNPQAPKDNLRFSAQVFIDESGSIIFEGESPDDARREHEKIKRGSFPIALAVPVVRLMETKNGERGFIFNETGHHLPQEVIEDIGSRVNESNKSSKPFQEEWISGMVGVDMMVAAHTDIRSKKSDENDDWNSIWEKRFITMSEVMGEEKREGERTQVNGPVQVGIIALHALARYPETFDPFMDNVVSLVKKNEDSGNI